jgi:deoxyribonuclease IV
MSIKFGPAGLGGVKDAISNLEKFKSLGIEACEIAFTYGVYIKREEDALMIRDAAEKLGIQLSIHAPYYVNLNSNEPEKVEASKKRILDCLKIGTLLNAYRVVFHPGFYGKDSKEKTYEKIKSEILDLQKTRKLEKYTPELAPETTGKINVFGSVEEIARLVTDTGCSFCIDFAHVLAREKNYKFKETLANFSEQKKLHIHFSGINYTEKGERNHEKTSEKELKKLVSNLPKNKEIIVINESPSPVEDSVLGIKIRETTSCD